MVDYTLFAGLALYALMTKLLMSERVSPMIAALVTVVGYFLISSGIRAIYFSGYELPLIGLVDPMSILTAVFQFAVAYYVFSKLSNNDTTYEFLFIWLTVGLVGIFYLAPLIVSGLLAPLMM